MSDLGKCCETVFEGAGFRRSRCSRAAKVTRNGKPYCTQHDPEKVDSRRIARNAKWDAEADARRQKEAKYAAFLKIAHAGVSAVQGTQDWQLVIDAVREWEKLP